MRFSIRQIVILVSGLATAILHLSLYSRLGVDPIVLNGFGYLALLAAYFAPIGFLRARHGLVWWALAGYTVLTILLWVLMGDKNFVAGTSSAIGYYAKAAELILLGALIMDRRRPGA